ncbi:uncharacterized protein [Palaemon carinicauda]|uniref:uncharacterized protein n=1 Tax=Palaemon carinicauda TaxID=392227 RepID=UPI0035B648B9
MRHRRGQTPTVPVMRLPAILLGLSVSMVLVTQAEEFQTSANTLPGMSWLQELASGASSKAHSRRRRFVQLPKGSSMEVKWSINLPFDTYSDYKAKFQLALPIKIPFPAALVASRSLDGSPDYVFSEDFNHEVYDYSNNITLYNRQRRAARMERTVIYNTIEGAIEQIGANGRHCMLRAICDVAEAPFDQGILGDIINALLTASIAGRPVDPDENQDYDTYIEAELHGKLNGNCEQRYIKCRVSPFDLIPQFLELLV